MQRAPAIVNEFIFKESKEFVIEEKTPRDPTPPRRKPKRPESAKLPDHRWP